MIKNIIDNVVIKKAKLDNDALTQQMNIVDGQSTEADKADKYKKVFGTCCENPQTQVIS